MQCTRCGWWEHSYTFSSDDIDEGLRATSTELTQAILRSYDIASKNVPIEVLNRYIAQNPEKIYGINDKKMEELVASVFKDFTKGKKHLYNFERKEYQYMELFQKYRNCVLHSAYVFSEQERRDAEKDIMYALIHILGILMSGENTADRQFMQEYLNDSQYALLLKNPIYNQELYNFLKKEYEDLYTCPYCSTRTMTIDYKCARCFNVFSDRHFFEYVNCGYCGEEMVICDAVNIEYNNNYIRGYCLNCDNDTTVYKCPKCGQFINAELFDKTKCHEGFCSVFE